VLYSLLANQQFVNMQDNRSCGVEHNPFGNLSDMGLAISTCEHGRGGMRRLVRAMIGAAHLVSGGVVVGGILSVSALGLGAVAPGAMASGGHEMVRYSVATQEQFVNEKVDRTLGEESTPFGKFKDTSPTTVFPGAAPYPGDQAIFKFIAFMNASFEKVVGTSTYESQYTFDRVALCDAVYQLGNGTLFASGRFSFSAKSFILPITGGTGTYLGASGTLEATPGPRHTQRLMFDLR
jgi:hypothetical protein